MAGVIIIQSADEEAGRDHKTGTQKITVEDKNLTLTKEEIDPFTQRVGPGFLVTTAYVSGLNAHLIVDGCKRSCAVQNKINNGHKFPPVTGLRTRCGKLIARRIDSLDNARSTVL